jgi:hypothetical protein
MIKDVIMREIRKKKGQSRPGRTSRRHRAAALETGPLGLYVICRRSGRPAWRLNIELSEIGAPRSWRSNSRYCGEMAARFSGQTPGYSPLAVGVAGEIAATMGWSHPYTLGVLHLWKTAPIYCQAVVRHDQRIGLVGTPAEAVDAAAKDLSARRLAELAAMTPAPAPAPATETLPATPEQLPRFLNVGRVLK